MKSSFGRDPVEDDTEHDGKCNTNLTMKDLGDYRQDGNNKSTTFL